MALTESNMMPLGTQLPEFSLPDVVSGQHVASSASNGKPILVMFICNHCPYVIHLSSALAEHTQSYLASGIDVVAISSNDIAEYPADAPDQMKEEVERRGYPFPYLFDESQQTAKAFTAACTPDFFLFDKQHKLAYRGRFDDSLPKRIRSGVYESEQIATGKDLQAAVTAVLNGKPVDTPQFPSLGCNIKWKSES